MSALAVVTKPADHRTDDVDLVAAVRAGDDRAFEALFVRYRGRIAAYVRGMVRDHERAEDITQEVFIAALRRLRATDTHIVFKPWIYEIAKNACIDAYRRSRHTSEVSFDEDESLSPAIVAHGSAPDAIVDAKLAIDNLCGAFGGLSRAHHDILVMREFEDLSYREIGERLGMSRAAVESTLFRARRRLTEEYEELVSGERCLRVRAIVDAPGGRAIGARDQRRMARHIAHCQPCRRHARLVGVDIDVLRSPAAARIAALLPLPAFVRRRFDLDANGPLLGHHAAPGLNWPTKVVAVLDPATLSGWPRAVAAAATVAVAGLGAGAAVSERDATDDAVSKARGARVAPALAPQRAAPAPALRLRTREAGSGRGPQPNGSNATEAGSDARKHATKRADEPKPIDAGSVPAGTPEAASGGQPASGPGATSTGVDAPGVRPALPGAGLPTVDVTAGDAPTAQTLPERPPLIEGAGTAVGDVDASPPDTLGDMTSTVEDTPAPETAVGATTVDPAPATSGPVSMVIGHGLDAAGSGRR